jgi:hypothetical protein
MRAFQCVAPKPGAFISTNFRQSLDRDALFFGNSTLFDKKTSGAFAIFDEVLAGAEAAGERFGGRYQMM